MSYSSSALQIKSCFSIKNIIYFAQVCIPFDPVIFQNFPREIIRDVQKYLRSRLFTDESIMLVKIWRLELDKQCGIGFINHGTSM